MARVALVSHDVQTVLGGRAGGVGAFVTHWANLLRQRGDDVTILLTRQETFSVRVDPEWRARYQAMGVSLVEVHNTPPSPSRWSDAWPVRLSEAVAPLLAECDIAYFQDWAHVGLQTIRSARFRASKKPITVTVLHGPSEWVRLGNRESPQLPDDLHVEFIERYCAQHSDHVIAPSRYLLDWARQHGWTFDRPPQVLGLPFVPGTADAAGDATAEPCPAVRRVVFFGRLEVRKGFDIFVRALLLAEDVCRGLDEVVLLGYEQVHGAAESVRRQLEPLGVRVTHIDGLDSAGALRYLAAHAGDSLVVIPSPAENFPLAVIETSLVPGLNMICSRGGGTSEVLGADAEEQLFDPYPLALAEKLRQRIAAPLPPGKLARYSYEAANHRWLAFHEQALEEGARKAASIAARPRPALPSVDVCITYYNKGPYFQQLLHALEQQTWPGFGVICVDDGSPDPAARAVFDDMATRYGASRGWTFFRQANNYVDAARNRAAERSQADYLLFHDADDLLTANAVERLAEAAAWSGDDCLLCGGYLFEGEGTPDRLLARYLTLGPGLLSGLVDPIVFGLPTILIRRATFQALGGYRELHGVAHEDWELQARLLLNGYRVDVLPEFLVYFRRLGTGLANTSDDFLAKRRLVEPYEERCAQAGLHGAATLIRALHERCQELEDKLRRSVDAPPVLQQRVRQLMARQKGLPRKSR